MMNNEYKEEISLEEKNEIEKEIVDEQRNNKSKVKKNKKKPEWAYTKKVICKIS